MDFGIPGKLLSDQDPAFESKLFDELMKLLEIKKVRTSGYRPQTNGLTEQSNSTVKKYLTSYLTSGRKEEDWDLLLKPLAYAYNSSVNKSTGYTPAELMFGRPFKIPCDMLYGNIEYSKFHNLKDFQDQMKIMYECAKRTMGVNQMIMKKMYDKRRKEDDLDVGEYVYVYNPRSGNMKLKPRWEGPYKVAKKSDHLYFIECEIPGKWLPRDRLRRCHEIPIAEEPSDKLTNLDQYSSTSDDESSSENDNDDNVEVNAEGLGNAGYNLRARPTPQVERFASSVVSFLCASEP